MVTSRVTGWSGGGVAVGGAREKGRTCTATGGGVGVAVSVGGSGVTGQGTRKKAAVRRMAGAAVTAGAYLTGAGPALSKIKLAGKVSERVTGKIGAAAAALTETGAAGAVETERRRLLMFKSKETVALQRSGLTGLLNRQNVIGRRETTASSGVTFSARGKTWRRGTITFKVGEQSRTITHLQSLSYPGEHYYFHRSLSDKKAVDLAGGRAQAETTPGFAGQIGQGEGLCAAWASAKRSMILARLHWGKE